MVISELTENCIPMWPHDTLADHFSHALVLTFIFIINPRLNDANGVLWHNCSAK